MKFQFAVLALAGAVAAMPNGNLTTSTVWQTVERTVISCAATVTNCPAESQTPVVITDTVALYTTICPVTAAEASSTAIAVPVTSAAPAPATATPVAPGAPQTYTTAAPAAPTVAPSGTLGTVGSGSAPTTGSAPIQTGAAVRAGPAFGGLVAAAAVAMML